MERADQRAVLDVAMEAGHILLENGAEIFRVEETIDRICRHFGVESEQAFVLSNGIFLTAGSAGEKGFAGVRHIPVQGAQLHRVAAVNQLSREIEADMYTLPQIREKLFQIRRAPGTKKGIRVLMSGIGSGCFCLMFGGSIQEGMATFFIGLILYLYLLAVRGHLSKIVENIGGGIVITVLGLGFMWLTDLTAAAGAWPVIENFMNKTSPMDMGHMISGAIMPLVPGLAFTNGIRDIADGDYISGAVRMLDAILVFLSIATGVGFVLGLRHYLTGGVLL